MWSILLFLLIANPCITVPQKIPSGGARENVRAARVADRFMEMFRKTRDFGIVWKRFRMSDPSCTHRANGLLTQSDYERLKLGGRTIEKLYIATMNFYFLQAASELSLERIDSQSDSAQSIAPREIERIEKRSKFFQDDERQIHNVNEVKELIRTLDKLTAVYRRQMPKATMTSSAWRENQKYLMARSGMGHADVLNGNETFCVPAQTKLYIIDRGIFYFYMVEERGKMRVAGLGID